MLSAVTKAQVIEVKAFIERSKQIMHHKTNKHQEGQMMCEEERPSLIRACVTILGKALR